MSSSIININNLTEEEINEFIFKFLALLNRDRLENKDELYSVLFEKINEVNDSYTKKNLFNNRFSKIENQEKKHNIIEGLFELIYFFEEAEEYENCATLKKVKDNLLMDM